jgi:pullulanase
MKSPTTALFLLALLPGAAAQTSTYADVYFRGTANGWGTQRMALVADHLWLSDIDFTGNGDANGPDRFKFDASTNWSAAFGDDQPDGVAEANGDDIPLPQGEGGYRITFNDSTRAYTVLKRNFTEVNFRGTPNGFGLTQMELTGHHTWTTTATFGSAPNQRFVLDSSRDWSGKLGDTALDGTLEANGGDVPVAAGSYLIAFNDRTLKYTVTPLDNRNFNTLYLRGTLNGWGNAPMKFTGNHLWEIEATFLGQASDRFRFDRHGDWSEAFGDADSDGVAEAGGPDIAITPGRYRVTFNDQTLAYTKQHLGAATLPGPGYTYSEGRTSFALWSPDATDVKLRVGGAEYTLLRQPDAGGLTDLYSVQVYGDLHYAPYQFLVNGVAVRDPYGRMVVAATDTNIVLDLSRTEPAGGWVSRPALAEREDAIVYEVHVRDFTINANSGVDAAKRGKFLGLAQTGTAYGGQSTGLDHLKELGVTHVQLLPIFDYATCSAVDPNNSGTCYNWGYDPENYNVPEERYALSPHNYEERIRELKTTINELHRNGIRVIMDVVYNHTWVLERHDANGNRYFQHPQDEYMFSDITLDYFNTNAPGTAGLAGTGNSLNPRVAMVSRLIRDSLEYWVREFNIDGFRFDLIGVYDHATVQGWANHLEATFPDRKLLVYGEPWNGFATDPDEARRVRLGTIGLIADSHSGCFNPKFREALKGNNDNGAGGGYIFNQWGNLWDVQVGSRGAIRFSYNPSTTVGTWDAMYALDPEQAINYVSAHDNLCLWDKINAWAALNGVSDAVYKKRINTFAHHIVLTSQGIPFLHGGEEILRTKGGVTDSYKSPDSVNQFDWSLKPANAGIMASFKQAIALRKAHPGLRMNTWQEITNNITTSSPAAGVLVNHIHNAAANGDPWSQIYVIYNSAGNTTVTLPSGTWRVAMEKNDPTQGNGRQVTGSIAIEGTAVTVLYKTP